MKLKRIAGVGVEVRSMRLNTDKKIYNKARSGWCLGVSWHGKNNRQAYVCYTN